jgi:hypothetical protein
MQLSATLARSVAPASRRLSGRHPAFPVHLLSIVLCITLSQLASEATTQPPAALDSSYIPALAAADRYLQAWQSADMELGLTLLSGHAKEIVTTDELEKIFSAAGPLSYEIGRGKLRKRGRYEFPVVLVGPGPSGAHVRRHFSNIAVVDTGNNDWAVDKLP